MTGQRQLYRRMRAALDKLLWGFGDLKRIFAERCIWPALAQRAVSADGGRWSIIGTRLRAGATSRPAQSLLVQESDCLWGAMQLPDMEQGALDQAVSEAMWRVSPLPPEQIVTAWHATPHPQGGWDIEWGVCRRSVQEESLASLGLAADATVYLARSGRAIAVRGTGWRKRHQRQRLIDGVIAIVLVLTLGAVLLPSLMPLVLQRQAVVRAVLHVNQVDPKAAPLRQQLDELRRQSLLADELRKNMDTDVPLASVINVLSDALPDDTWLDRIEVNGREVRIMGLTADASELVARLGRQTTLAEVRASGANVRDGSVNKERFTFEMRWRGEGVKP